MYFENVTWQLVWPQREAIYLQLYCELDVIFTFFVGRSSCNDYILVQLYSCTRYSCTAVLYWYCTTVLVKWVPT